MDVLHIKLSDMSVALDIMVAEQAPVAAAFLTPMRLECAETDRWWNAG